MRNKIERGEYKEASDFRHDFNLVISNAKLYNARDTIYWKSADKMEEVCLRMIDRTEKQIEEEKLNELEEVEESAVLDRKLSLLDRKDSLNVKEEDIDIMGIDANIPLLRKMSRQGSDATSVDLLNSRAMTPTLRTTYKKKKKKPAETGVLYGPDGSLHTVGGGKVLR